MRFSSETTAGRRLLGNAALRSGLALDPPRADWALVDGLDRVWETR